MTWYLNIQRMNDKNTQHLRGLFSFLRMQCSAEELEDEFVGKKTIPTKGISFSLPPSVKNQCSCNPVLIQWALFSTSSVKAVAPMTHDICITLPGSKPTVKMVWVNEKVGAGWKKLWTSADWKWVQVRFILGTHLQPNAHCVCKGLRVSGRLFTELLRRAEFCKAAFQSIKARYLHVLKSKRL